MDSFTLSIMQAILIIGIATIAAGFGVGIFMMLLKFRRKPADATKER